MASPTTGVAMMVRCPGSATARLPATSFSVALSRCSQWIVIAGSSSARSTAWRRRRSTGGSVGYARRPANLRPHGRPDRVVRGAPLSAAICLAPFPRGDAVRVALAPRPQSDIAAHRGSLAASRAWRSCTSSTSRHPRLRLAILRQCPERELTVNPHDQPINPRSARCGTPALLHQPQARHEHRDEPSNNCSSH